MKRETGCDFEPEIIKSLRHGFFSEDLKLHLRSCDDCRETAKISRFFQMNLPKESASRKLPSAGLVWWKSRQREKRLASEKIARATFIMQMISVVIIIVPLIAMIIYQPAYFSPLAAVLKQTLDAVEQMATYLLFIVVALAIMFAVTFFTLTRLTADER